MTNPWPPSDATSGPGGSYPQPGGYPQQSGYPQPGGYPQQSGYPQPGGYPPQNGYPVQPYYGAPVDPNAPYGRQPMTGEPLSDKSKVTAGLLQLFLGGFGVGRFYIGSTGIAVGQLVTWILGLLLGGALFGLGLIVWFGLGIWVLVDAIMIFNGSVRDQYGRPLS